MASGYRPCVADAELRACLGAAGAVVIEGPKASGKTRLAAPSAFQGSPAPGAPAPFL